MGVAYSLMCLPFFTDLVSCECNLAAGSCKFELCYSISVNTCRTTSLLEERSVLPPLLLEYISLITKMTV